ncbi:hypothetical protein UC8_25510 [Roseimaritima ulvae]|uniref:Uncharacterized protein n=1 Tax=Roseimaritima ulvae TaxID=980254 RepID=A0A5B9QU16_9BACT|nr:hypothetical protein UC8_25510 [Roseimaritima ulvae]
MGLCLGAGHHWTAQALLVLNFPAHTDRASSFFGPVFLRRQWWMVRRGALGMEDVCAGACGCGLNDCSADDGGLTGLADSSCPQYLCSLRPSLLDCARSFCCLLSFCCGGDRRRAGRKVGKLGVGKWGSVLARGTTGPRKLFLSLIFLPILTGHHLFVGQSICVGSGGWFGGGRWGWRTYAPAPAATG